MQSIFTAICNMIAKVSGLTVGLKVCGIGDPSRNIFAASWSPHAVLRALCLSGRPLPFFLRMHLRVVPICQYFFIALTSSVETGTSVLVSFVRSHTSLRIASLNCSASGALSASRVDMFLLFSSSSDTDSISGSCVIYGYNACFVIMIVSLHMRVDFLDNIDASD